MPLTFNTIPNGNRVPRFFAEFDGQGNAGDGINPRLLLIGQMTADGSATPGQPVQILGNATALFGAGSQLDTMFDFARNAADYTTPIYALPLADEAAATAAQWTLTFAGAPTAAGTLIRYIGGLDGEVKIGVSITDTATTVADAFANAVNANTKLPVTAAAAAGVVTLTAKNAGTLANGLGINAGLLGYEADPAGLTIAAANTVVGAVDPDMTTALSGLASDPFDWIAQPYTDLGALNAVKTFFDETLPAGRWSPLAMLFGHAFTVVQDTLTTLASTYTTTPNDKHQSIIGYYGSPTPGYILTALVAARAAKHLSFAPELSRPLHSIDLPGAGVAPQADRFDYFAHQALLTAGVATLSERATGELELGRLITTYRLDGNGAEDTAYLDVNTLAQLQYAIRAFRAAYFEDHGRNALANDSSPARNGVSRPKDIRATLVGVATDLFNEAVIENIDLFVELLIVERNALDSNRVDVSATMDLVNQLITFAMQNNFVLQARS